jgi:inhibitor of KinA sporulation pathway (predicted exonuclease)
MPDELDQIVVIDVEATCWPGEPPPGQESEIIEIGVCVLDTLKLERRSKESLLVRPERSEVSPFCTELTSLLPVQVAQGLPFPQACAALSRRFRTRHRVWASWGEFDRTLFDRQCAAGQVPSPFGRAHLDIKKLFAFTFGLRRAPGLAAAMERLSLAFEGSPHRGHDDAWNTALVLATLLRRARGA